LDEIHESRELKSVRRGHQQVVVIGHDAEGVDAHVIHPLRSGEDADRKTVEPGKRVK
jgi:hypothetical protein